MEAKIKLQRIIDWMEKYKQEANCRGVVVGVSGGKDSTVVTMLAKKVFGDNVFALLMPNGKQADIGDSLDIVKTLKVNYRIVNLETVYNSLLHVIERTVVTTSEGKTDFSENCPKISQKATTNIPPRLRMTTLYAVAQTLGYRVIGTGNASEAFIGWTTKWGDSAYDFNPIANLTCREVREIGKILATEFNLNEKYIDKQPSDGLCGKTDEESFGFTYSDLDNCLLKTYLGTVSESVVQKIRQMHTASNHKRKLPVTPPNEIGDSF